MVHKGELAVQSLQLTVLQFQGPFPGQNHKIDLLTGLTNLLPAQNQYFQSWKKPAEPQVPSSATLVISGSETITFEKKQFNDIKYILLSYRARHLWYFWVL